ncbi:hypothetical protein V2J09_020156, partial [Rumex salicifolius]
YIWIGLQLAFTVFSALPYLPFSYKLSTSSPLFRMCHDASIICSSGDNCGRRRLPRNGGDVVSGLAKNRMNFRRGNGLRRTQLQLAQCEVDSMGGSN